MWNMLVKATFVMVRYNFHTYPARKYCRVTKYYVMFYCAIIDFTVERNKSIMQKELKLSSFLWRFYLVYWTYFYVSKLINVNGLAKINKWLKFNRNWICSILVKKTMKLYFKYSESDLKNIQIVSCLKSFCFQIKSWLVY